MRYVRNRPVQAEDTLRQLAALLEFHASVQGGPYSERVASLANEEVRATLEDMVDRARADREELAAIVRAWRRLRPVRASADDERPDPITLRELVEGWVEIKRTAAELYSEAADQAPSVGLAARLRALADSEARDCERLAALL